MVAEDGTKVCCLSRKKEKNSSRTRVQECLNALISSDVRSYRVPSSLCGSPSSASATESVWSDACEPKLDSVEGVEGDGEGSPAGAGGGESCWGTEVAMTRKVVRSKSTTSVAPHASASFARCRVSTDAFGISVCTIRDHAYIRRR